MTQFTRSSRFCLVTLILGPLASCASEGAEPSATTQKPQDTPAQQFASPPPTHESIPTTEHLRLVRFPHGRDSQTIASLELSSLVMPWVDKASGLATWVLAVTPDLEKMLAAEGLIVSSFAAPPEYEGWSEDRQLAWNLISKECQNDSGQFADPLIRRDARGFGNATLDVNVLTPYGSYYLPYRSTTPNPSGDRVFSFRERAIGWKNSVVAGTSFNGLSLPSEFLGGYPWDTTVTPAMIGSSNPVELVYFDLGWKTEGIYQGRPHKGPKALLFIGANQHPREMITFETAWRLVQRMAFAYGSNINLGEWQRPTNFWRDAFDAGLHVIVVPTINPLGYEEMTRVNGTWQTYPATASQGSWNRTNPNFIDLNRNWPEGWLQKGKDGRENWGTGTSWTPTIPMAGRAPASEQETQAVLGIIQGAFTRMTQINPVDGLPYVSDGAAAQRFPAVGVDLHSSSGKVLKTNYLSRSATLTNGEAFLCGVSSDCVHPDEPVLSAIFGNNARPSMVGNSGLAVGLPPSQDDPPMPYGHGRSNYNIYPSSGALPATLAARRWQMFSNQRGMPAATLELGAFVSGNPFGFGTCAPPSKASQAIDQIVEDVAPLIARMVEGALNPANLPAASTPLQIPNGTPAAVPYAETENIVNLGVVVEAAATAKTWTSYPSCNNNSVDDVFCHSGTNCSSLQTDVCSGTWWSSYTDDTLPRTNSLQWHWLLAVKIPPRGTRSGQGVDADLQLLSCTPAIRCPSPTTMQLLRKGSFYNLYRIPLVDPNGPPGVISVRRRLIQANNSVVDAETKYFVAAALPFNTTYPASGDPQQATNKLQLSMMRSNSRDTFRNVRIDMPIINFDKTTPIVSVSWTKNSQYKVAYLKPSEIDWSAKNDQGLPNANWVYSLSNSNDAEGWHWYSFEFDLVRTVLEQSGGNTSTSGVGIWAAWSAPQGPVYPYHWVPPVLSAELIPY